MITLSDPRSWGSAALPLSFPPKLVERYEAMVDNEEGRIAAECPANIEAGRTSAVGADEARQSLGF